MFAANPMRSETLEEMNLRIATRMLAQRHGDKIMMVFETVKKQWPGIVTDEPLAIFEQCGKYPINYHRSPDEFRPPRKPEVNPPFVAKTPEFTPLPTAPPQRIQPSQRIPMGPIAPDYVYDATPDIGDQLNAHIEHIAIATFTVFKSIFKRLMNPELAPTSGELREHAKQCLDCFIGINEQLRHEQLEALEASMTVSKRAPSIVPQPKAPALAQTKILTPNQARHALEQKPDPDDRCRKVDPQTPNTPAPDSALTVDNEASLRRKKEAAAERRRNLEALAFTEQDMDLLRNHLATNPKTSVGAAVITRMVRSLADSGDQSRLNELLDWLTDNCTQVPSWFNAEFELHQNALDKEEAAMKNKAEELARTNSGPEGLVR